MKNIVCLVGLILLGFFVLKHFNLIEGMVEGVEGGGGGGGGGGGVEVVREAVGGGRWRRWD